VAVTPVDRGSIDIHTDDLAPEGRQRKGDRTVSATDVENAWASRKLVEDESS